MNDVPDSVSVIDESSAQGAKPKKVKAKKRPSDFEIVRTMLTRVTERKHAYIIKNLGEDSDIIMMCSVNEKGFTYGSPELSIAMIKVTDPDLRDIVYGFLGKLYGLHDNSPFSGFVCLRDQMSEIGKSKGESFEVDVHTNSFGAAWTIRTDKGGKPRTCEYATCIESLFHVQLVADYCKTYRPILDGANISPIRYPYQHRATDTGEMMLLPRPDSLNHPFYQIFPHGFRTIVTKGADVLMTKCLEDFPYPVLHEDMIIFERDENTYQFVHHLQAQGWQMLTLRPNAVYFPPPNAPLSMAGNHKL